MDAQTITAPLVIIRGNSHYIETGDKQSSTLCRLEPTFDPSFEDRLTTARQNFETQQLPKASLKAWLHFLRINGVFANHNHPFVHILNGSTAGERFKKQAVTVTIDQANLEAAFNTQLRKFLEDAYQKRVLKNKVHLQDFLSRERSGKNAPAVYKEVHKQFSSLLDEQKPNPSYIGTYVRRHKTYNRLKVYQRLLDDLEEGKAKVSEPIEPTDQEEEEQQALDGDDSDLPEDNKAIRIVTASLQNIVHPDFEPSVLQEAFRKEQGIVSKHMKSLSRFIEAFTTKVTTGEISKISGYPDSTTKTVDIDFRDFATDFEFDKEAETKLRVAPVQEDLQKIHQSKLYIAEHLSNITVFLKNGQGNVVDENGRPEPMGYIVDQEQFALETISSHTQYLQKKPAEKSRANSMQIDNPRDEDSRMREVTEKRTYTSYTPQDKVTFFKMKIEKCMNASAAAKQLGIHARTVQRWVKQYEERPDSIFESGKKKGRRRILTEEHKKTIIDFIDANPSAAVVEVTEHLVKQFNDLKVSRSTVYNFMRTEYNLSLKKAEFQSMERNSLEKIQEDMIGFANGNKHI
ncbi:hypothetical protein VTP01DRAFT_5490 [Rhizomucor pusillus]|uniref:uncharacterized protein n=1 Tax=Rhizomucor pusillus TaxID=4840 RepID=UPI00374318F1